MIFRQLINRIAKLTLGNSAVNSIIAQEGKISLKRYRKTLSRKKMLIGEFKGSKSQLQNICEICSEYISPVTSPIALISQVQRSGGSLLSQLFDGHPELHAHPHELKIGYPKKYMWPKIDLNEHPQRWLEMLFEDKVIEHSKGGYKKERKQDEVFPFIFMPSVQRRVFLTCALPCWDRETLPSCQIRPFPYTITRWRWLGQTVYRCRSARTSHS